MLTVQLAVLCFGPKNEAGCGPSLDGKVTTQHLSHLTSLTLHSNFLGSVIRYEGNEALPILSQKLSNFYLFPIVANATFFLVETSKLPSLTLHSNFLGSVIIYEENEVLPILSQTLSNFYLFPMNNKN